VQKGGKSERKKEERIKSNTHLSLFVFAPQMKMQVFSLRLGIKNEEIWVWCGYRWDNL